MLYVLIKNSIVKDMVVSSVRKCCHTAKSILYLLYGDYSCYQLIFDPGNGLTLSFIGEVLIFIFSSIAVEQQQL